MICICPNCGKEMKQTNRYEDRWKTYDAFWTQDYVARVEHYNCKDCKIKRKIDEDFGEDKWTLPPSMQPTEKQISYAESIIYALGLDSYEFWKQRKEGRILVTKQQYWKFISEHTDEMTRKQQAMYDDANDFNYDEHYDSLL